MFRNRQLFIAPPLGASQTEKQKMINLLQEKLKTHRTNSTFAIRTSRHTNQKLQKSYFFSNPREKDIFL